MQADPMPSSSEKSLPCPFCGEKPYSLPDAEGWIIGCGDCDFGPASRFTSERSAVKAWNDRESRAVSPDSEKRDADYANRNIRTMELANAVAVHLGLNPADEIPFEELTRRLHDLPPVDGFGSHKADLAELRVLQKKVQEGKSLSPSPAATSAIVSTYHGPVGGNDERGVVVRLCVDDVIEVRPEKGPVARLSAFSAQALAYSLLDFAIQPYAGDIARRAIDAKFGASPADTDTQDAERLDWLDAEARRLMDRDPLGYRTRVILTAEEVNNAGRDIRKAIDNRRSSSPTPPTTQKKA